MATTDKFTARQIVWAKVEPYPWWPGRVIKKLEQDSSTLFKVCFFADSTYCFLNAAKIIDFQQFDPCLNAGIAIDFKLTKAVQLATKAHEKMSNCKREIAHQNEAQIAIQKEQAAVKESKMNSEQKIAFFDVLTTEMPPVCEDLYEIEVTAENVLQLIGHHSSTVRENSYCYSQRKQSIKFEAKLQFELLKKYKLHHLQSSFTPKLKTVLLSKKPSKQNNRMEIKRKLIKRAKQIKTHYSFEQFRTLKINSVKRIFQLFRHSNMNNRLLKQQTVNTINKMEDFAEGNHLKFKSLFVALVRSLKTTLIETASLSFDSFLAYMEKLENEKQFDEQGSKMTQISVS